MKTIDFILPAFFAPYFINCDCSGLNDEDLKMCDYFDAVNIKKYGEFYCVGADVENIEFSPFNDMPGMRAMGADVCKFTFVIGHPKYKNN